MESITSAAPVLWIVVMVCAVAVLLWAEWHRNATLRAVGKLTASTAFIALALSLGAWQTSYGRWVLLALVLSWVGDACLLSDKPRWFLTGLVAFLLGHAAYGVGFATSGALTVTGVLIGIGVMVVVMALVMRWLWTHLDAGWRPPVLAYVLTIGAMCALAIARSIESGHALFAIGALAFAASDVAVARERFVSPVVTNKLWGLPLYYAAQVALAYTVTLQG